MLQLDQLGCNIAASIELYLDENILTEDGSLIPIQWTEGYENAKLVGFSAVIC